MARPFVEKFNNIFGNIVIEKEAVSARLMDESLFSVDIVEYLIAKGESYRKAHDIVGSMVRDCLDKGKKISNLSLSQLKQYSPHFGLEVFMNSLIMFRLLCKKFIVHQ